MPAQIQLREGVIRRLREARGINSDEVLARMIGVDRGTLRRVENGAQPSGTFVANACVAFGMGIGEMFEVIESRRNNKKPAVAAAGQDTKA